MATRISIKRAVRIFSKWLRAAFMNKMEQMKIIAVITTTIITIKFNLTLISLISRFISLKII